MNSHVAIVVYECGLVSQSSQTGFFMWAYWATSHCARAGEIPRATRQGNKAMVQFTQLHDIVLPQQLPCSAAVSGMTADRDPNSVPSLCAHNSIFMKLLDFARTNHLTVRVHTLAPVPRIAMHQQHTVTEPQRALRAT